MKRVLILNGGYSEIPLIRAAKENGYYVVLAGKNENSPGNTMADKYCSVDYSNHEAIFQLAKNESVEGICSSCMDVAYLSAAYACDKLGLPGHDSYDIALRLHHKNKFREQMKISGLPMPEMVTYHRGESFENIKKLKMPVIVKPIDLASGVGMTKCYSVEEVERALKSSWQVTNEEIVVVEEFIEGSNHGCTTLIKNHKVVFFMIDNEYHEYSPYAVSAAVVPSSVGTKSQEDLLLQIEKIAHDMKLCDGLLHIQFILNEDGTPVILEACRRSPGDLYIEFVKFATGVDYPNLILETELGKPLGDIPHSEKLKPKARHVIASKKPGRVLGLSFSSDIERFVTKKELFYSRNKIVSENEIYKMGVCFMEFCDEQSMIEIMGRVTDKISIITKEE